jgi:hypothetical protein
MNYFQPYVVLVSQPLAVVRFRARAVYLFSYGISRTEFSLGESLSKVAAAAVALLVSGSNMAKQATLAALLDLSTHYRMPTTTDPYPPHKVTNSTCRDRYFSDAIFTIIAAKNDPQGPKQWPRKTRPAFLYTL